MASILDRLLGRTETALAVHEPPVIDAKAVTGPGAFAMQYHTPLHSFSRDPHRLMAEAQGLFRTNGWVGAAERELGKRFVSLPWHLEDEDGETVDDSFPEPYQAPLRLLTRPSPGKLRSQVFGITFRHVGLCGNAFWYLDQRDMLGGTPLSIMYINPARMTPASDEAGNVVGWILDHPENQAVNARTSYQSRQGTPLSVDEVIHFTLDEPDWGVWGIGIAESAQRKIELDALADSHGGGVLASGGRLSGLVSPKTGVSVTDDQWVQFVRDWRSITSDPDAAKRLQIAKMPLDFQQMTASPKDLQLLEVSKSSRDDILGMWGVPLSVRGIAVPAGLNADRGQSDQQALVETVRERSEPIRETIQAMLLDRWEELGVKVTLILDYPSFDDDAPLYESAAKSINVAITNNERRAILGLDPLEDEGLGKAIYIASGLTRIDEEPEAEPVTTLPPSGGPLPGVSTDEEMDAMDDMAGKAKADLRKPLLGLRTQAETTWEPKLRRVIANVLAEQRSLALSKTEHALRKQERKLSWWNDAREHRRFMVALEPTILEMARDVAVNTTRTVKKPEAKADTWLEKVIEAVRASVGARITGINNTTREKVQAAIALGVEAGDSPAALGVRLRESAAFDEYRAELISRTETASVYNDAALNSYGALDVEEVEAIDGDHDAECAARNGKRYPIEEAMGITDHPNGTLDWVPVVKAVIPPDPMMVMAEAFRESMMRPPAVINVTTPDVTVYPQFHMPEQPPQPAPVVNVNLPEPKPITRTVKRDANGRIDKVIEQ